MEIIKTVVAKLGISSLTSFRLKQWNYSFEILLYNPHKPLVAGSNPAAATITFRASAKDQGIQSTHQSYPATTIDQGISLIQAINNFLLSCKMVAEDVT